MSEGTKVVTLADVISQTEEAMRRDDAHDLKTETLAQRRKRKLAGATWRNTISECLLVATDGEILAELHHPIGLEDKWYVPMLGVHYLGGEKARIAVETHIAAAMKES